MYAAGNIVSSINLTQNVKSIQKCFEYVVSVCRFSTKEKRNKKKEIQRVTGMETHTHKETERERF